MVLTGAGINTSVFSVHSTRAASTSATYNKGISIDKILAAAGWSWKVLSVGFIENLIYNMADGHELPSSSRDGKFALDIVDVTAISC